MHVPDMKLGRNCLARLEEADAVHVADLDGRHFRLYNAPPGQTLGAVLGLPAAARAVAALVVREQIAPRRAVNGGEVADIIHPAILPNPGSKLNQNQRAL